MQRCTASVISNAEQSSATIACAVFGSDTTERSIGVDVYVDDVKIAKGYIGM